MTLNSRIKIIRKELCNDSTKELASKLDVSSQAVSNYVRDGYNIGREVIENLLIAFSNVDANWLLTGKGEMYKSSTDVTVMESTTAGVPYYESIDVSGGIVPMFNDNKEIPTFYINYPHFNDCTAYLPVVGDSMYPKYASGEIIAVKQIFNLDMIQWGEAYLVIGNSNTDDLRTIKLVHPHPDDPSKIVLRASNPNFKGDTPICINDIVNMYIVKGKITRSQL